MTDNRKKASALSVAIAIVVMLALSLALAWLIRNEKPLPPHLESGQRGR